MAITMKMRIMTTMMAISVSIRPQLMPELKQQWQLPSVMMRVIECSTISRMSRMKVTRRMTTTVKRNVCRCNSSYRMIRKVVKV